MILPRLYGVPLLAALIIGFPTTASAGSTDAVSVYSREVIAAGRRLEAVSPASRSVPDLKIGDAYRVQRILTSAKISAGAKLSGFKGGLVRPGQTISGAAVKPIFGTLFGAGATLPGAEISLSEYNAMVIECEVAFTFAKPVHRRIGTVAQLQKLVGAVRPAIELPNIALSGPIAAPQDLIAINVGSARYILGRSSALDQLPMNLSPVLRRDGSAVAKGNLEEAVGDPWKVLLVLVNDIVGQGYAIEPGQTVLSGAIAALQNPPTGIYTADFGQFGEIGFTLVR